MKNLLAGFALFSIATLAAADCQAPWGQTIFEGGSVIAYLYDRPITGTRCQSEVRTCMGGILMGSFRYRICQEDRGCMTEFGYVADGSSVVAYLNPIEMYGEHCKSESRFCFSGQFSGSYPYISCQESF